MLAGLLACVLLCGCVASKAFRQAETNARGLRWDQAVIGYSKALALDPGNLRYSVALARAKLKASQVHFERAKRYLKADQLDFAVAELQQAVLLDHSNQHMQTELEKAHNKLIRRQEEREPTKLEVLKERSRMPGREPPRLSPGSNIPIVLKFRDHEIGKIYDALSKASGINFLYDAQLDLRKKVSIDVSNVVFEKALDILMMTNKHFFKIMDESTIIVAQDTRQKRQEYQELVIKTFYLSNAEVKDVQTLLRTLLDARKIAQSTQLNAITIRDTPQIVEVAERIIHANDKAKAELVIDVEILEINRSMLQTLGLNLTSNALGLTFQGPDGGVPLNNLQLLRQTGNWVLGPVPGVSLDFLRSDSDTKVIARPQLRVTEGEKASIHIGDRVPIPTTTFNTANTVGGSIVPITSFVYQEVGIIIDIEPRVHHNREVTLKLRVEVSALGPSISTGGGISQPQISTREIETVIRLRDGETNLLAGLIQESEQQTVSGLPGLANVPFLRRIFARNSKERRTTDIVLTLTPHIIRIPDIREEDLQALWIGTEQNIHLSGATRKSAFGGGPFGSTAAYEEALEEEEQEPLEEAAGETPAAPAAGAGKAPPPAAPGLTVSEPQALEQPPAARAQPETQAEAVPPAGIAEAAQDEPAAPDEEGAGAVTEPSAQEAAGEAAPQESGGTPEGEPETPPAGQEAQEPQGSSLRISLEPSAPTLAVGTTITLELNVSGAENLNRAQFVLEYNPSVLKLEDAMEGDLMSAGGVTTAFTFSAAAGANQVHVQLERIDAPAGVTGDGTLCTFIFSGVAPGATTLGLGTPSFQSPDRRPISATLTSVQVEVQ
ncbi:MAG: secretin N-terminal domain-containing protein [Acidobacteriota bacterium]